ncbi:Alpha amylase, catalytic subdomain [Synechococcus sp. CC9902]|uniref:alpha-amylase family glycosyl hydrolase n=1 Tax=Synechococcus sp. (strain CC9902) TaxID=316279 RepID=UPI00005D453D|nr:alpha-amylase family glycosyl hydrolase [Synechococcus sp. CC9902]ABB27201.1 Alpha amylase, catalytic subdomain [Synechococcus sp. CC9902]
MQPSSDETLRTLLSDLYRDDSPGDLEKLSSQLLQILSQSSEDHDVPIGSPRWKGDDAVLITYANTVADDAAFGLQSLRGLVNRHLEPFARVIHVLPFLKSTSDGGFAVSSYQKIEQQYGDWSDLSALAEGRRLMADLVLNHVSASHPWVQQFLRNEQPGESCVLEASPDPCWNDVVRPRSSALFTQLSGPNGRRQVWTTFGPDQVDLDWHHPQVLIGFIELLNRLLGHGVRWIRLDAVGFVWKEPNTSCIHLPQAHRLVQVLRYLLDRHGPDGVVVTETNVPEQENLSYLRNGQEAHLAYNFPLPPLLLEAAMSGRADLLNGWLTRWPQLPNQTGLLNFTACHDGVGLRPLEGLMADQRVLQLLVGCERRGGLISHRRLNNGEEVPYEINISWWSAMADGGIDPTYLQRERFLLTQLMIMALPGVPAFYLPALLAAPNDLTRFRRTGHRRDLNRPQFTAQALERRLADPDADVSALLPVLKRALSERAVHLALHPDASMQVLSADRLDRVILQRSYGGETLVAVHNITASRLSLRLGRLGGDVNQPWADCLSGHVFAPHQLHSLEPYAVHWLVQP